MTHNSIRCPRCGWWVAKVSGENASFEANCGNSRCHTVVLVEVSGEKVIVTGSNPEKKQAQA